MIDPRRRLIVAATLAAVLLVTSDLWAGPPTDQLRGHIDRVVKVLDDPDLKAGSRALDRRVAVRRIVDQAFDFTEMAQRSLGQHWAARTATERDEFVQLFADLLERTYLTKLNEYSGEAITYTGEAVDGEHAVVKTRIVARQGTEVPVDYQLLRRGERWFVYDVRIEGVSLVANYRTQFNRIVQTTSYRDLVRKLQVKRDEGNAQARQTR